MEKDLELLYSVKDEFDEVRYRNKSSGELSHVYKFNQGVWKSIAGDIAPGYDGEFEVEGLGNVEYVVDRVRGNPMVLMSHSFEKVENALNGENNFLSE